MNEQQLANFNAFIIDCTVKNATIPHSARMGVQKSYTVQELVNSQPSLLRSIGEQIEKAMKNAGSSRFKKDNKFEIPAGSGIPGDKWLDFIELCIERAESKESEAEMKQRIKEIQDKLGELKTPAEVKAELEEELKRLTGKETPVAV